MKKTLKLAGLLLALVMVLSMLPIAAMAEDTNVITVNGAIDGKVYTAYKIFDIVSYDNTADPATAIYKVNTAFAGLFADGADGLDYFDISDDANEFVTVKTGKNTAADMQEFAKIALAYAEDEEIVGISSEAAASGTATIAVNEAGYYLVDSVIGSLCALNNTIPNATVVEKNEVPTITKTVKNTDNGDSAFADSTTASIGDIVTFKFVITIPKATDWAKAGAENFVVTDSMTAGLTLVKDETHPVTVGTLTDGTEYTYADATQGFTLTFDEDYLDTLADEATIEVTYSALVNAAAVNTVDTNTVTLAYGDSQSTSDTATVTNYGFDLAKIDGTSKAVIDGATFKLYDAATDGNEIALVLDNGVYRPALTGETGVAVPANVARIDGLAKGTYYLEEVTAPAGYNKLTERQEVVINGDIDFAGTVALNTVTNGTTGGVLVANNQGSVLPETGGMGTTLLYVVGAILVIGAGVLLVSKKRMAAK